MSEKKIVIEIDSELKELIPGFLSKKNLETINLKNALSQKDYKTISNISHIIKGSGGGYGFDEMSEIGSLIEQLAKKSPPDNNLIEKEISRLLDYLNRLEVKYV